MISVQQCIVFTVHQRIACENLPGGLSTSLFPGKLVECEGPGPGDCRPCMSSLGGRSDNPLCVC